MKRILTVLLIFWLGGQSMYAQQTEAELLEQKAKLEAELAPVNAKASEIKAQIAATQAALDALPGWNKQFFGTLGGNLAQFNNWFAAANPHSQTTSLIATLSGLADYDSDKILWKNSALLNIGAQRIVQDTRADNDSVTWQQIPDQFLFSSLFGYKINSKLAASAEMAYRTPILNNFNNPGDLDLGVGVTWTPLPELFVLVHPLNYHWKFGDNPEFNNAVGARVKAGYAKEIYPGVSWVSLLEGFYSYQDFDPAAHWWEWNNGVNFKVWKGIGVGVNFAFRAADSEIADTVQSRWNIGLSYSL